MLVGLRIIYAQAFKQFDEARKHGYTHSHYEYTSTINKMQDYYTELESNESDEFSVIKKNYRRLMKEHHYDSLVSKGLPQEMLDFSEDKTKKLNEAYAAIKEART